MQRKWYLTGVSKSRAIEFEKFLEEQHVSFKRTEALHLVYFDYRVNEHDCDAIASWLKHSNN